jgi:hypothetical protein
MCCAGRSWGVLPSYPQNNPTAAVDTPSLQAREEAPIPRAATWSLLTPGTDWPGSRTFRKFPGHPPEPDQP